MRKAQPWIHSAVFDSAWILGPAWLAGLSVILFPEFYSSHAKVEPLFWAILVMGVDVSHVYSTLYRTYWDQEEWKERKALYILIPALCWVVGALLYSMSSVWFWRVLAYVAVFHFVRQQYGIFRVYTRNEANTQGRWSRHLDALAIYSAPLFPVIYWHCTMPKRFVWFVEGDFVSRLSQEPWSQWILGAGLLVSIFILVAYVIKEAMSAFRTSFVNWPKNIWLFGTLWSWNIGIVLLNEDLAFTMTNVVAHGVPYIALVWIFGKKQGAGKLPYFGRISWERLYTWKWIPAFVGILLVLAYFEEALWDGMVWRQHRELFSYAWSLPAIRDPATLSWLVPLLTLPQVTHYVLDGFIWKLRKEHTSWTHSLLKSIFAR